MKHTPCQHCTRKLGQSHDDGCPERMEKVLTIRWNHGLIKTMIPAPAGYMWELVCGGYLSGAKTILEAFELFIKYVPPEKYNTVFARCISHATSHVTVIPFIIGESRITYRKARLTTQAKPKTL